MNGRRWVLATAVVGLLGSAGCGSVHIGSDGSGTTGALRCEQPAGQPGGLLVLIAQAVPDAVTVPCLGAGGTDWSARTVDVHDGRARIGFSYRYGGDENATLDVTATCDVGQAREVSSRFDGVRRFDHRAVRAGRFRDEVFHRYDGGCAALRFDMSGDGADLRAANLRAVLGFLPRADLDRRMRDASDGHLHLDPA